MNINTAIASLEKNGAENIEMAGQDFIACDFEGKRVLVDIGGGGYCTITVNGCVVTNMAQPYNVGECVRLQRHVGVFENV